jgi:sterol 3beta-glucosyltransferase
MRISILTLGTRGDVQPYLALGIGLAEAGHEITLGTSVDFEDLVQGRGLRFVPFELSIRGLVASPDGRAAFESPRAAMRLRRKVVPLMPRLLDDAWAAARHAQAILFHPKILNGLDIAEKLRVPAIMAFYLPALSPTRAFPAPFVPGPASWGGPLNRASHHLFLRLLTAPYHRLTNRWRAEVLQLPPRRFWTEVAQRYGGSVPKLYGFSRHLVPIPADWDESANVTGHWFLDESTAWQPPPQLAEFLASGPAPVCIGFGSIAARDPEQTTRLVLEAVRLSGRRAVMVGGWGGLCPRQIPGHIHFLESAPYQHLFPHATAVVHHGGAGSTTEGLRAGMPTVVCPFFGDQPFWGRRVHALGAGPPPLPQKHLTAQALAKAIRTATTNPEMRHRAAVLGERIRAENGVGRAVQIVNNVLKTASSPPQPPLA